MAFDDGTPLDAAALQALDTKLNEIRDSIPRVSSATNDPSVENKTGVIPEILGGLTSNFKTLEPGKTIAFPIKWGKTLSSAPTTVILTPAKSNNEPTGSISYAVDTTSVDASGCTVNVYLESGARPYSMKFYWLVVTSA